MSKYCLAAWRIARLFSGGVEKTQSRELTHGSDYMFEDISKVLLITDMDGTFLPASYLVGSTCFKAEFHQRILT